MVVDRLEYKNTPYKRERLYQMLLNDRSARQMATPLFIQMKYERKALFDQYSDAMNMFSAKVKQQMIIDQNIVYYMYSHLQFIKQYPSYSNRSVNLPTVKLFKNNPTLRKMFYDPYRTICKNYKHAIALYTDGSPSMMLLDGMLNVIIKNSDPKYLDYINSGQYEFNRLVIGDNKRKYQSRR